MNELELKKLWQSSEDNIANTQTLLEKTRKDLGRVTIYQLLANMRPLKIFTIAVGLIWVYTGVYVLGSIYMNGYELASKFFLYAGSLQVALTAIALWIYVYQLIKIYQVELTAPVLETQKTLATLRISTLWCARILFLQLPLWTIFWWNTEMLSTWNFIQWIPVLLCTGLFTFAAIWLFVNLKFENRNKRWFKLLFGGSEWRPLMQAMHVMEELEEPKK